jgi:hypothetical protein
MALDVDTADRDEEVETRDQTGGMLDGLVDVDHSTTSSEILFEVVFQFYV